MAVFLDSHVGGGTIVRQLVPKAVRAAREFAPVTRAVWERARTRLMAAGRSNSSVEGLTECLAMAVSNYVFLRDESRGSLQPVSAELQETLRDWRQIAREFMADFGIIAHERVGLSGAVPSTGAGDTEW